MAIAAAVRPAKRVPRIRKDKRYGAGSQAALALALSIVADVRDARIAEGAKVAPRCRCASLDWNAAYSRCRECGSTLLQRI